MSRPITLLPPRRPQPPAPPARPADPPSAPHLPAARRQCRLRPGGGRPLGRATATAAVALLLAVACTSCVLAESTDYVVQPAPPNGIHVTLRRQPTKLLGLVSDLVTAGIAIDPILATKGLRISCDGYANVRALGDRCAFRVLAASRPKGSLVSKAVIALAWGRALAAGELGDFSRDTMAMVRRHPGACAHVTIRGVPRPVDANWTWRSAGSRGC